MRVQRSLRRVTTVGFLVVLQVLLAVAAVQGQVRTYSSCRSRAAAPSQGDRPLPRRHRPRGMDAAVCVNKVDLLALDAGEFNLDQLKPYEEIGIPVLPCSARTGEGLDALARMLAGRVGLLLGPSGVGRSSLIHALSPGLNLASRPVRKADGRGRHTTTASTLHRLAGGLTVNDTPGFREFTPYGILGAELRAYFPEFAPHARGCRFAGCSRATEPDCRVRRAVRDGAVSRERYESYLKLLGVEPSDGGGRAGAGARGRTRAANRPACFTCAHCGTPVTPEGAGSQHRNHCPRCLWSLHLDHRPGDRAACCGGKMKPVAVWIRSGGEWALIHRCGDCGAMSSNRIAADDNEMLLLSLAVRPLASPPFPLSRLGSTQSWPGGGPTAWGGGPVRPGSFRGPPCPWAASRVRPCGR